MSSSGSFDFISYRLNGIVDKNWMYEKVNLVVMVILSGFSLYFKAKLTGKYEPDSEYSEMNSLTTKDKSTESAANTTSDADVRTEEIREDIVEEKNRKLNSTNIRRIQRKDHLTLDCSLSGGFAESQGSPDSDGDILGVLDYTPDVLDYTSSSGLRFVPYCHVFEPLRFSDLMPHVFIRNQNLYLRVVDMEILPSALNFFTQCEFTIILHHGSTHWTITRKSRQITSLHNQLRVFKTMLKLPAATSEERDRRHSMREQMKSSINGFERNGSEGPTKTKRLVKFPRKSLQRMDKCTSIDVETYLGNLLHHSLLKGHSAVLEFFEISPISFVRHLGPKLKEGFVKKSSGARSVFACCDGQYKRRWLVLRETCLFCISPGKGNIRTVMLIDPGFQVSHGFRHTRISKGLLITNYSRSLVLKCDGDESEKEWSAAIEDVCSHYAADFSKLNRHLSFAPVRSKSYARWYVDGAWFMSDVADLLELAQEEIFITDWWLSPDIYMKRPDLTGKQWKLNEILKRQAERGVRIFILLYKEVELALGLNSLYSKQNLCHLNPNIKVLRHPDHYRGSLYWAHHEKMVIVDQMHAFVGGIDLCYGRWDDYRHKLVDLGHAGVIPQKISTSDSILGRLIVNTHDLVVKNVSKLSSEKINLGERSSSDMDVSKKRSVVEADKVKVVISDATTSSENVSSSNSKHHKKKKSNDFSFANHNDSRSDSSNSNSKKYDSTEVTESECDIYVKDEVFIPNQHISNGVRHINNDEVNASDTVCVAASHSSQTTSSVDSDSETRSSDEEGIYTFQTNDNEFRPRVIIKGVDGVDCESVEKCSRLEKEKDIFVKSDQQKLQFKMTKNLRAVKSLGMDLVEEMREKKKGMKHWTEKRVPRLKRTGSFDSELGLPTCSEEEEVKVRREGKSKRFRRKLRRRVKSKKRLSKGSRASSTGSLINLHKELVHEEVNSVHLWLGKDYVNWITKDLYDAHIPFNDTVNRHQTPRMPWHDISLYVEGPAARDAARHFILRWNAVKSEKMKNNERYPYLIPKTYKPSSFLPSVLQLKHRVKCQVVRSIGNWSGGLNDTERSIYNAYLDAIKNAEHFIYIENQFFISSASLGRSEVANNIAYYLYERILKAYKNKETFRVFIVLPLLPAFEGQIGTASGIAMQYILHYTYQSIISGPNSLIGKLLSDNVPWQQYLSICALRTHDVLEGKLVSELIYVHSKLLIVDDRLVIAGSANINDRSLMGNRDSEVDLVIEDEEFTEGKMNGKDYLRGEFAGSLRIYLFSEHLGISEDSDIDVSDPTSEKFFVRTWQAIASKNTKIYDEVFNCIPCDAATTFAELRRLRSEDSLAKRYPERAKELLKKIQGRLVMYPLMFLKDEVLKPGPTHKEYLLPIEMWL